MQRNLTFSLLALLVLLYAGCDKDSGSNELIADQTALLTNLSDNVIVPSYQNLVSLNSTLKASVETFLADVSLENLISVQNALKAARLGWQDCMMFDFGPASTNGLASTLNIFPIDKLTIENNIQNGNFSVNAAAASDERGYQAISYLVHGGETDQDLVAQFDNSDNRKTYLLTITDLILQNSVATLDDWENEYQQTFKDSQGTDVGSSLGQLVNALTQTLERNTRDAKLGIPVGLRSLGIPNPDRVEGLYTPNSVEFLVRNLNAYKNLFTGTSSGDGLLDYLDEIEAKTIDNENMSANILAQLDACIVAAELIQEPLYIEVVDNPEQTNATIAELQRLLVLIKTEMVSAIGISITYQDNDGD